MNTPDTDVMAEALKMVNESKEQFKENLSDVSFVTTPDTECGCTNNKYCTKHFNEAVRRDHPELEKGTPDTEWEEKVKAEWSEYDNGVFRSLHSTIDFISTLLTARDTYWKERVRKIVDQEQRKHNCPPYDGNDYDHGAWKTCEDLLQALDNLK